MSGLAGLVVAGCCWCAAGAGGRAAVAGGPAAVPWRAMVSGMERGARASRLACHPLSERRVVVSI